MRSQHEFRHFPQPLARPQAAGASQADGPQAELVSQIAPQTPRHGKHAPSMQGGTTATAVLAAPHTKTIAPIAQIDRIAILLPSSESLDTVTVHRPGTGSFFGPFRPEKRACPLTPRNRTPASMTGERGKWLHLARGLATAAAVLCNGRPAVRIPWKTLPPIAGKANAIVAFSQDFPIGPRAHPAEPVGHSRLAADRLQPGRVAFFRHGRRRGVARA